MEFTKPYRRILASALIASSLLGLVSQAHAYSVYRRVTAGPNGVVVWAAANFGVGGNPSTLSFFHFEDDDVARAAMPAAQCFVKVELDLHDPQPGATTQVGNPYIVFPTKPADQPRPFPWTIVFDNDPGDHWSIPKPEITDATSNNAASRVAAAGFRSLATTSGSNVTVINGNLNNCVAQHAVS